MTNPPTADSSPRQGENFRETQTISNQQCQLSSALTPAEEAEFLVIANQLAAMTKIQSSTTTNSTDNINNNSEEQQDSNNNNNQQSALAPPAHVLPLRRYLEASILPLLTRALEAVALTKPNDPLEFLAAYLLSNNPVRQNPLPVPPCGALSGWLSAAAGSRPPALADEGSI